MAFLQLCLFVIPVIFKDGEVEAKGFHLQAIYWKMKPFVYFDRKTNKLDGIFPKMFKRAGSYCDQSTVKFVADVGTRQTFEDTMLSDATYGEGILKNITTPGSVAWFTHDLYIGKVGPKHFRERNLTVLRVAGSDKLAVIQPRDRIVLPHKLERAIAYSSLIVLISFILALFFGTVMWMYEKTVNPALQDKSGPFVAIYWSFATLTTVGYGDVVPVTMWGKLLSIIWMFSGLIVASVLTASLTDVVTGSQGLSIANKRVAVVRNSHEEYYIERDHFALPISYNSYEDVLQAVRNEDVYAGALPYDIAAWMYEEIKGTSYKDALSVVYTLNGHIPFRILVPKTFPGSDLMFECMLKTFKYEVVTTPVELLQRKIDVKTIFYDDIFETIFNDLALQLTCGTTMVALVVALLMYFTQKSSKSSKNGVEATSVAGKLTKIELIEENIKKLSDLLKDYKEMLAEEQSTTVVLKEWESNLENTQKILAS